MLPPILLGIRSAVKERLGRSAAEMTYGMTLRLPGDFTENYTVDAHTVRLRVAMSRLKLSPSRETHQKDMFQYRPYIRSSTHVHMYFCNTSQ